MEILEKAIAISLFCLGLNIISGPGMILYFLRKPFDKIEENNEENKVHLLTVKEGIDLGRKHLLEYEEGTHLAIKTRASIDYFESRIKTLNKHHSYKWLLYLMKPILLCITCMSSFWTIVIELGYYNTFTLQTIIIAFVVAALNSIIHALYVHLR